jgi:hypothetical protein
MKKKLIIIGFLSLIAIGIMCFLFVNFRGLIFDKPQRISLEYGTHFPGIPMYSMSNEKINMLTNNSNKVVFYLSSTCSSCVDKLDTIKNIINLTQNKNTNYYIMWQDHIPTSRIKKANIDEKMQLSLNGKFEINNVTPEYFILDENNNIEFIAQSDLNALINKLWDEYKNVTSTDNLNKYILENYARIHKGYDRNKKTILFFSTSNCEGCKTAQEKVTNEKSLLEKFNLITIGQEEDNDIKTDFTDQYKIYSNIYKIKYFPKFLIIDSSMKIEDTFNDIDSLLKHVES